MHQPIIISHSYFGLAKSIIRRNRIGNPGIGKFPTEIEIYIKAFQLSE